MVDHGKLHSPAGKILPYLLIALAALGLYASSFYSYLLFHSLIEVICVVVVLSIFVLSWNSRTLLDNHYILFLGISFLCSGALELIHTFAFKGFGVFPGHDANLPTQLWIASRYVFSLSFLIAPAFITRRINAAATLTVFAVITALLFTAIFSGVFPNCFVEGRGLTPFKVYSEYIIIVTLLASLGLLIRKRALFDARILRMLAFSIVFAVAADAAFTKYISVYGPANLVGHLFLFLSAALIYRAIVVTGVEEPRAIIFRNLEQSETQLQLFIEHSPAALAMFDHGMRYLRVSRRWRSDYGLGDRHLTGVSHYEVFPEISDRWKEFHRRGLAGEVLREEAERFERADGSARWVRWEIRPWYEDSGGVGGIVIFSEDITERKRAEEVLRQSEERYRTLFDTLIEGFCIIEVVLDADDRPVDYRFLECNPAFEGQTGLQNAQGKRMRELVPEHEAHWFEIYGRVALTGEPARFVNQARALNRWCDVSAYRVGGPDSRKVAILFNDITERKQAEDALRESERRERERAQELATLFDAVPMPVFIVHDPDSLHITGNRAADELLRNPRGAEVSLSAPPEVRPSHFKAVRDGRELQLDELPAQRAARGEHVQDFEFNLVFEDGTSRDVVGYGTPLLDEAGHPRGAVHLLVDITERKRTEKSLREASDAAGAAARAKAEFLANMSHEIRTPMNAVIGFTDLLLSTPLNANQRRFLDLIKNSGEALLDIVNDVLDLSKMEAGKYGFVEEAFDLRDLIEKVGRSLGLRAHQKGLELTAYVPLSETTAIIGDPARLRQVLVNLVGNAVKFTENGEVHLSVNRVEPPASGAAGLSWFRFSVRDTGIGIPRDQFSRLFQSFQQVDPSTTRQHEGTGLGLFISRRIVEQMGGSIDVESQEGKGSTFSFAVPFRLQTEPGEATVRDEEAGELRGRNVLVVDDNATNRMILLEMLTTRGMAVALANGGEEALGLLRATEAAGQTYELLLVDCHMPRMDGFQLIERIKGDGRFQQTAVVMITSDDLPAHSTRARVAGAAAHLVKPVASRELFSTIRAVLAGRGANDVPTPAAFRAVEEGRPLRLLLAEDNTVNQILVRALVEREGWSIDVVENGRDAVAALSREARYDLVLMDVQMPVMDGYEATRSLRDLEKHDKNRLRTPVVGLTARALPGDRQRCLDAGMDDYLAKPLESQALYRAIRQHVQSGEMTASPVELSPPLRDNPALLGRLVESFLADLPQSIAALRDAVDRRSPEDVEAFSHRLRGSLVALGAQRAADAARRLEECGRERRPDEAPPLWEDMEEELRRLVTFLDELRGS